MSDIDSIVAELRAHPHCAVLPPSGLPKVPHAFSLPSDLQRFYELIGGAVIHTNHKSAMPMRILPPSNFQRIDTAIAGAQFESGPFDHWYAVANNADGNFVSIDLHPEHAGLCYDSFHETFAMPGYVSIIAVSFTDLLTRLLRQEEDSTYWIQENFTNIGEAFALYGYDSVLPENNQK